MAMEGNANSGNGNSVQERIVTVELAVMAVAALSTTLMLEAMRVFLSYLVFVIDQSERMKIGRTAVIVFALFFLGGLVWRAIGAKGAIIVAAVGLAGTRLWIQFAHDPDIRLYAGAATVVAWGWLLLPLRSIRPDDAGRGVVYGLLLDLIIRFLFGSVDLPWMPGAGRHVATIAIVLAMLAGLTGALRATAIAGRGGAGAALIGVGPGVLVFQLATGNLGVAEIKSEFPVQMAIWITAIGIAAGFAMQIRQPEAASGRPVANGVLVATVLTMLGVAGLFVFWRWGGVADLGALAVSGVSAQLLVLSIRGRGSEGAQLGPIRDAGWLTLGMLLLVGITFVYYAETGMPLLIGLALIVLGLGAALSAPRGGPLPALSSARYLPALVVAAAVLLLAGLGVNRDLWNGIDRRDALGSELTVMTYNIQAGFSKDNVWDLEATARVIEAQQPDIVILEEVARGWIITSGADQARWLSHRLNMNLAWGPSAPDDLWGVAILSKGDILSSDMRIYKTTKNLRRGVLGAAVKTTGDPLFVYATHLDNPSGAGNVRLDQTTQLLSAAGAASPAIIGGDFNASPDTDVVAAILAAGFVDTGASLRPEDTTSEGGRRIDYIFVRGPFRVIDAAVLDVWTSDHRPFVTHLKLE